MTLKQAIKIVDNMNKELKRENFSDALMAFKIEVYKALKIEVVVKAIESVIKKR